MFAVDLLGFGGSDKVKEGVEYELELWRDLLVDFMEVRIGVINIIKRNLLYR